MSAFWAGTARSKPTARRVQMYNENHTGDPDPKRRWDSQYYSLWITDGGGGTFKDIWTPDTFAQAGLYVSDTKTSGRMYCISIEHHVRNEVKIKNVSGWQFYAMQTEEERGRKPALPAVQTSRIAATSPLPMFISTASRPTSRSLMASR